MSHLLLAIALFLAPAQADPWEEVAATAELPVSEVKALLEGVEKDQTILDRMATPWEAKPWFQYAKIFDDPERVQAGLAFREAHGEALRAAEAKTGVPAHVILGILGVETKYGQVMGNDPILRSLYTLGFHHERRGAFFRKELGHFLRLGVDQGWEIGELKGSYAGAMGYGQFIPSSYRRYAVDGDGDGKRDLFASEADAIASVANYFAEHGWKGRDHVLVPVSGEPELLAGLVSKGLKPDTTWGELAKAGVTSEVELAADEPVKLFAFETEDGPEYLVGTADFYVITRYNHSKLYARAVWDLARKLE